MGARSGRSGSVITASVVLIPATPAKAAFGEAVHPRSMATKAPIVAAKAAIRVLKDMSTLSRSWSTLGRGQSRPEHLHDGIHRNHTTTSALEAMGHFRTS